MKILILILALLATPALAQTNQVISQWPIPPTGSTSLTTGDKVVATRGGISYGVIFNPTSSCSANTYGSSINAQGQIQCSSFTGITYPIYLGTSAAATNPQNSADVTTGLFSSVAGSVSISGSSTEITRFTSAGVAIGASFVSVTPPSNGMIVQGTVGIGTSSPTTGTVLDMGSTTASELLPVGTTGQRPSTGVNGMTRYNSTNKSVEAFASGVWNQLHGGSDGTPLGCTGCSSVTAGSTDTAGTATTGTSMTSIFVSYSSTLGSAPRACICGVPGASCSATTTTGYAKFLFSTAVSSALVNWICVQ